MGWQGSQVENEERYIGSEELAKYAYTNEEEEEYEDDVDYDVKEYRQAQLHRFFLLNTHSAFLLSHDQRPDMT